MAILSILLQLGLAIATAATPSPLTPRGTVASSAIVGLPEAVPAGTLGNAYETYQPFLWIYNGCVPVPAVDVNGNTNAGLPLTGASNSGCSSNLGQIYVRGAQVGDNFGLLYSWYMPKDEPSPGLGHTHEWEGAIVWLADENSSSVENILAVCPSQHGSWKCSTDFIVAGTGALIGYISIWPVNHMMVLSNEQGGQQPLVAWESLSEVELNALQNTDFGSATVQIKDGQFLPNLQAATF